MQKSEGKEVREEEEEEVRERSIEGEMKRG